MKVLLFTLLGSFLISRGEGQPDFSSEVRRLFYGADLNSNYKSLLRHFSSLPFLKKDTSTGWSSYPPLSTLAEEKNNIESSFYTFTANPFLPGGFQEGTLTIERRKNRLVARKQPVELTIYLDFNSKEEALATYNGIIDNFRKFNPYTDSSLLVMPNAFHMYADATEQLGISVVGLFHKNSNSISITLLH